MKLQILAFITIAAMSVIGPTNAETWECAIGGAEDHKVILTQESDPALSDEDYVGGTVTGPYGKKHKASVSIDGFNRRWDYESKNGGREYAIFMDPDGQGGFIDFTGAKEGERRDSSYALFCEESITEEERTAEGTILIADNYIHAIRQKVERNWIKPVGSREMPLCKVHVEQGPGGIILDVAFGPCSGSTAAYRASIENAVYKSEPLPTPGDPELFEREINFYFDPEESSATSIQKSPKNVRSADEIERVFQQNGGIIFNLYNRALRKNPSLSGQVVVVLTISPDGQVTAAKMLSSELGDETLERKLIAKIKKFNFSNANVREITVTYPIDFLPS